MKLDKVIQLLDYIGLKRPLARLHFHLKTTGIPKIKPTVKRVLPHDPTAYTQGLAFYNGRLYESTGLIDDSRLRCIDPESGKVEQEIRIENEWCEGVAVLNNCLTQLTYTSGRAICYDPDTLQHNKAFSYDGEGWGLASSNEFFLMSNGSNELTLRDTSFSIVNVLPVLLKGKPLQRINDLAYAGDKIYANVQFDNNIYEISELNGSVLRIIDCQEIIDRSGRNSFHEMINGIAYSPETKTFYVTGKNWPYFFEISVPTY